jgi:hypothetical protein
MAVQELNKHDRHSSPGLPKIWLYELRWTRVEFTLQSVPAKCFYVSECEMLKGNEKQCHQNELLLSKRFLATSAPRLRS